MKKLSKLVKAMGVVAALALGFVGMAVEDDEPQKDGLCKAFGCGGGGTGGDPEEG